MADKLTHQITEALTRAAAESAGLPLYMGKHEAGLFQSTAAGKLAAQKCLGDGLVEQLANQPAGKQARDRYALTEKGWNYLLAQLNPKQVLEDFVRILEARRGEVSELLEIAQRMAESLQGLKQAVARVLPSVIEARIPQRQPVPRDATIGETRSPRLIHLLPGADSDVQAEGPVPTAILDAHPDRRVQDCSAVILSRLKEWSGTAGEDCPLPELFRSLGEPQATIGEFHDCLRRLRDEGAIYLHPWTGPLYALPEPAYALLAGHNVAYYASVR